MKSNLLKNYQKKGIWGKTGNTPNLDGVQNQMSAGARSKTEVSSLLIECSGRSVVPHFCSRETTALLCCLGFLVFVCFLFKNGVDLFFILTFFNENLYL